MKYQIVNPSWGAMGKDLDAYGMFHAREVEPTCIICHILIFTTVCTFFQGSKMGNSKTGMSVFSPFDGYLLRSKFMWAINSISLDC